LGGVWLREEAEKVAARRRLAEYKLKKTLAPAATDGVRPGVYRETLAGRRREYLIRRVLLF
jgi:hypothetical protein